MNWFRFCQQKLLSSIPLRICVLSLSLSLKKKKKKACHCVSCNARITLDNCTKLFDHLICALTFLQPFQSIGSKSNNQLVPSLVPQKRRKEKRASAIILSSCFYYLFCLVACSCRDELINGGAHSRLVWYLTKMFLPSIYIYSFKCNSFLLIK